MRFIIAVGGSLLLSMFFSLQAMAADSAALLEVLHNKGILDDASYSDIKGAGKSGDQKLLDVLHNKGILDDSDYNRLSGQAKKEAEGTAVAAAAPQSSPAAAAPADGSRPFDKAFSAVEEGFAKLGGDTVKLKIGAFVQAGWLNDDAGFSVASPPTNGLSTTAGNQFFVRRARLFFNGELGRKLGFRISIEPAIDANATGGTKTILRDAYFYTDHIPYARITIGQFAVPFSLEEVEALGDHLMVNRSLAINYMHNPTRRDIGVMLSGKYMVEGMPLGATYGLALVNGTGYNISDDNDIKDIVGRVTINPFIKGLNIGGSFYSGMSHLVPAKAREFDGDRQRWGAEFDYVPAMIKGLKFRGEFVWDRRYLLTYASKNVTASSTDPFNRYAHSYGWYLLAGYRVNGLQGYARYLNDFEPVVRYDYFDEDTSTHTSLARTDERYRTTLGLNYYINKYAMLKTNYEIIHAGGGLKLDSLEKIDNIGHHLFTTLVQIKF